MADENVKSKKKSGNGMNWLLAAAGGYVLINAIGTGVGYKQAFDNLSYSVIVKSFKVGGSITSPNLRLLIDVLLSNPTKENFTIEHPDLILLFNNTNIGFNTPKFEKGTLAAKSQMTIKDIDFTMSLMPILQSIGIVNLLKTLIFQGFEKVKEVITAKKAEIMKKLVLRMMLNINGVQINFDSPLS